MVIQLSIHNENTISPLLIYALTANNYCLPLCVVEGWWIMMWPFIPFLSQSQCKTAFCLDYQMNNNAKPIIGWNPSITGVTGKSFSAVGIMSWWISCQKWLMYNLIQCLLKSMKRLPLPLGRLFIRLIMSNFTVLWVNTVMVASREIFKEGIWCVLCRR